MLEEERQKWLQAKQQLLPFDFWEEEKREAEEKTKEVLDNLPHFEVPKTDNEYLLECQWQYKHGDDTALARMYKRSKTICLKFINAIAQKNPHVKALTSEAKKIKAEDAATYIIEQYIKRSDFVITKNYPAYLFLRIAHELYYMRKVDHIVDFVDFEKFFKEGDGEELDEKNVNRLIGRQIIKYNYADEKESEEDQEERELKQFYMWRQKQREGGIR